MKSERSEFGKPTLCLALEIRSGSKIKSKTKSKIYGADIACMHTR